MRLFKNKDHSNKKAKTAATFSSVIVIDGYTFATFSSVIVIDGYTLRPVKKASTIIYIF